ncbi:hypothetical protein ACFU8Q_38335, partial [Streptomyces sp. NPDC057543]|uniref:hypothetical protein n=1 Tax=Streptomyces sp. NPDC057543 TaxID=3346163 RepID=UPI0036BC09F5
MQPDGGQGGVGDGGGEGDLVAVGVGDEAVDLVLGASGEVQKFNLVGGEAQGDPVGSGGLVAVDGGALGVDTGDG